MSGKINGLPLTGIPANLHDRLIMADRLFVQARAVARVGNYQRADELRDQAEKIYNELEGELEAVRV